MVVGIRKPGGPLSVSFVVYDEAGRVIAKLVDSTLAYNERRAHELDRSSQSLVLKNNESGRIVLKVELEDGDRVKVALGDFLTIKGHRLEILPIEWRVDKHRQSGGDTDAAGGSVVIG